MKVVWVDCRYYLFFFVLLAVPGVGSLNRVTLAQDTACLQEYNSTRGAAHSERMHSRDGAGADFRILRARFRVKQVTAGTRPVVCTSHAAVLAQSLLDVAWDYSCREVRGPHAGGLLCNHTTVRIFQQKHSVSSIRAPMPCVSLADGSCIRQFPLTARHMFLSHVFPVPCS